MTDDAKRRLTKRERAACAAALDFILAGELDEDLWSDGDIKAMESAREKLTDDR